MNYYQNSQKLQELSVNEKKTVLVVDDNPDNINLAVNILVSNNFNVGIADSGQKALQYTESFLPDLILLDIMMPGMDGYEVCSILKSNNRTKDIPVIFLTVKNEPEQIALGFELGAVDYITKPFFDTELVARVNTHISLRNSKIELQFSQNNLETILDNISDAIYIFNLKGICLEVNRTCELRWGYDKKQLLNKNIKDFIWNENDNLFKSKLNKIRTLGEITIEEIHKSEQDNLINVEVAYKYISYRGENVFLGVARDITDRLEAEKSLRESEEKYKSIFKTSSDAIIVTDLDGNFIDFNDATIERSALSKKEILKSNLKTFLQVADKESNKITEYFNTIKNNGEGTISTNYSNAINKKYYIEINGKLTKHNKREVILHISRNITQRYEQEKQKLKIIIEAEENERKRFAKEIHDGLGATLSAAKLYLGISKRADPGSEKAEKMLLEAIDLLDKAITTAKEIAVNISPHDLSSFGLIVSLQNFCKTINLIGIVNIKYSVKNFNIRLEKDIELNLFRAVNELINNTLKYAEAKNIKLVLEQTKDRITIQYKDDGIGFDSNKILSSNITGTGLSNIIQRAKLIGGICTIKSSTGKGMSAVINIQIQ